MTFARLGLRFAWRQPGLAAVLWLWTLLLGGAVAVPAWTWWYGATATTPGADLLLTRFSFAVMTDLMRGESPLGLIAPSFVAVAFLAFLGQALVAGGTIEILTTDDTRPFLHRFFRGAGHFFARFLRASVYGWLAFLLVWLIVLMVWAPLGRALENMDWEPAWYLGWAARWLILGLLAVYTSLAIDYARVRMAREDSRRAMHASAGGFRFVATHLKATLGVWLIVAILTATVIAVYLAFGEAVPAVTWATILLSMVAQQVTMLVRAGLRVALVGAEIAIWTRSAPAPEPVRTELESSHAAGVL